jgi:hypothetical protein
MAKLCEDVDAVDLFQEVASLAGEAAWSVSPDSNHTVGRTQAVGDGLIRVVTLRPPGMVVRMTITAIPADAEPAGEPPPVNPDLTPAWLRDTLLHYMTLHEMVCTTSGEPGTPCWRERCNVLGYLCHSLGVSGARLAVDLAEAVAKYDEHCGARDCKHGD